MNWKLLRSGAVVAMLVASLGLVACESSILEKGKIDYKGSKQRPTLELPPDLAPLGQNDRWGVPGAAVDASDYETNPNLGSGNTLSNVLGDITFKRDGDKRWLEVKRSPQEIWGVLEDYWQDLGFMLVLDEPTQGIMETDWAENRAKIPQDFIRGTIGKLFDGLYSTGERDKFRTRVEVGSHGTEIFITHRGVVEVFSSKDQMNTTWQPRPADTELEAEMLRRLMMRLGAGEEQSRRAAAEAENKSIQVQEVVVNGYPALKLEKDFDAAWRWVGVSLDRISFTVVDRDRANGIYHVRYDDYVKDGSRSDKGVLGGLFSKDDVKKQDFSYDYQIKLSAEAKTTQSQNTQVLIQVLDKNGSNVDEKVASKILTALAKSLE